MKRNQEEELLENKTKRKKTLKKTLKVRKP